MTKRLDGTWGKIVIAIVTIGLTICGMLLASGRSVGRFQERLDTVCAEQNKTREMTTLHDKKIAVIETQLADIYKTVQTTASIQQEILNEIRAQ